MINYRCIRCSALLETPGSLAGLEEPCPVCQSRNLVPAVSPTTAMPQGFGMESALIGTILLLAGGGLAGLGLVMRSAVAYGIGVIIATTGFALRRSSRTEIRKRRTAHKYCRHCGPVTAYRKAPDYLLHAALALGTCGASMVLLLADWLLKRRWCCGTCNRLLTAPRPKPPTAPAGRVAKPASQPARATRTSGFWSGLVYAIGFVVGLCSMMQIMIGQGGTGPSPEGTPHVNRSAPGVVARAESERPQDPEARSLAEVNSAIKRGTDLNAPIRDGLSPLHWAARNGFAKVAKLLLEHGANVNLHASGMESATPLHVVAVYGHKPTAEALLTGDADVNAMDKWSSTPLQYASFNGHDDIVDLLISRGARVNNRDGRFGVTAVQVATAAGKESTVRLLVGKGADINTRNDAGETPLGTANRMNQTAIARFLSGHGARQ